MENPDITETKNAKAMHYNAWQVYRQAQALDAAMPKDVDDAMRIVLLCSLLAKYVVRAGAPVARTVLAFVEMVQCTQESGGIDKPPPWPEDK